MWKYKQNFKCANYWCCCLLEYQLPIIFGCCSFIWLLFCERLEVRQGNKVNRQCLHLKPIYRIRSIQRLPFPGWNTSYEICRPKNNVRSSEKYVAHVNILSSRWFFRSLWLFFMGLGLFMHWLCKYWPDVSTNINNSEHLLRPRTQYAALHWCSVCYFKTSMWKYELPYQIYLLGSPLSFIKKHGFFEPLISIFDNFHSITDSGLLNFDHVYIFCCCVEVILVKGLLMNR